MSEEREGRGDVEWEREDRGRGMRRVRGKEKDGEGKREDRRGEGI